MARARAGRDRGLGRRDRGGELDGHAGYGACCEREEVAGINADTCPAKVQERRQLLNCLRAKWISDGPSHCHMFIWMASAREWQAGSERSRPLTRRRINPGLSDRTAVRVPVQSDFCQPRSSHAMA